MGYHWIWIPVTYLLTIHDALLLKPVCRSTLLIQSIVSFKPTNAVKNTPAKIMWKIWYCEFISLHCTSPVNLTNSLSDYNRPHWLILHITHWYNSERLLRSVSVMALVSANTVSKSEEVFYNCNNVYKLKHSYLTNGYFIVEERG